MFLIAEHRYVVSAIASIDVIVYADDKDAAVEVGKEELWAGVFDTLYIDPKTIGVDLLEWEDET